MKKSDVLIPVSNVAQLNIKDLYVLNTDVETYSGNGKVLIPSGSVVNFLSLTNDASLVIIRSGMGLIEQVPFVLLSEYSESIIGKVVHIPKGIDLFTSDGVFAFEKDSHFIVEAVFYTNYGQYRPEEKTCFIRYLNNEGKQTAVTGTISFYEIELLSQVK